MLSRFCRVLILFLLRLLAGDNSGFESLSLGRGAWGFDLAGSAKTPINRKPVNPVFGKEFAKLSSGCPESCTFYALFPQKIIQNHI